MNRNRKLRKQMMSGLAVGMAAVMGAAPVYAATGEDAAASKEETVYVNANADGSEDQITVSNWLKNAGTEKNLKDESELKDIKNVKGDEKFTQSGNKLINLCAYGEVKEALDELGFDLNCIEDQEYQTARKSADIMNVKNAATVFCLCRR